MSWTIGPRPDPRGAHYPMLRSISSRSLAPMPYNSTQFAWLIEAPGQNYLYVRTIGTMTDFSWTKDHNKALRFMNEAQADTAMMAIRGLAPAVFGFAVTLGEARPVEHGWLAEAIKGNPPKPYDSECEVLAQYFLADRPIWRMHNHRISRLAHAIQDAVEAWFAREEGDDPGRPVPPHGSGP